MSFICNTGAGEACHGDTVIFGQAGVTARRQYHRADRSLKQACHIGVREEGNGLIKGIARFYIRENQYIGLPIDGRHDALNVTARLLARCLYVQRAVDNDIPEFAGFGQFLQC